MELPLIATSASQPWWVLPFLERETMELPFLTTLASQPWWVLLLSSLGFISFSRFTFSLLKWLYIFFLRPPKDLLHYGKWAVLSGSTDGIGKALALEFSRRGLNLLLIGRNSEKLKEVVREINSKCPLIEIKTLVMDLAGDISEGIKSLEMVVEEIDVGILVNSAGISYVHTMFLHEVEEAAFMRMLKINLGALTEITRVVVPVMLRQKRGAILNIGSGATVAIPSHPLLAVYASTKAYVDSLSRCLHTEYKGEGIHTQCQVPLFVATKMVSYKGASFFAPVPEDYARTSVRFIGYESRCMTYWPHFLQWCLLDQLPDPIVNYFRLKNGLGRRQNT